VAERNAMVPRQRGKSTIGFVAALFAVWCQIVLVAAISLAPLPVVANPLGGIPICHADDGSQPADRAPGHPAHDCAMCVLCVAHAVPLAVLLPLSPLLPERLFVAVARLVAVQPRAPPLRLVAAAQPRGPPSLT
jgi:hypothetical protein